MINNIDSIPASLTFKQETRKINNNQNQQPKQDLLKNYAGLERELGIEMPGCHALVVIGTVAFLCPLLLCTKLCKGAVRGTKNIIAATQKLISKA